VEKNLRVVADLRRKLRSTPKRNGMEDEEE
jgi:hypothetical protein